MLFRSYVLFFGVSKNCYWCCKLRIFVGVVDDLSTRLRRGDICNFRAYGEVRIGDNCRNYVRRGERKGDLIGERIGEAALYKLIF